jgi:hypothetical protein
MRRTALMFALAGLVGALVAVPIAVYASHQFTDVPNTNPFHADIDWLADAGVTKGCSTTGYCPKDNVTREQMAAFMRRLSGNDPGVAPSVNADKVDGFNAQQLAPRAVWGAIDDVPDFRSGQSSYSLFATQTLVAPAPGTIIVTGSVSGWATVLTILGCQVRINGVAVTGSHRVLSLSDETVATRSGACSTNGAMNVPAGTYEIAMRVETLSTTLLFDASIQAIWIPFDGNGNTP